MSQRFAGFLLYDPSVIIALAIFDLRMISLDRSPITVALRKSKGCRQLDQPR